MTEKKGVKKSPTEQGSEVGYKKPPKNRQFGQPGGNPRHNGSWKKEDNPRWIIEQMFKLSKEDLQKVLDSPDSSEGEKNIADLLLWDEKLPKPERVKILEKMMNQAYGMPKQPTEVSVTEETIKQFNYVKPKKR